MLKSIGAFVEKYKILAIPIVIVAVFIIGFCLVGSSITNPNRIVSKYVDNLISSNWQGVYRALDLQETDFVNYNHFVAYQESNDLDYSDIKNYTVKEVGSYDSESPSLIRTYVVSYVTIGASAERTFVVKLLKQSKKALLFYPTYKISTDEMLGSYSIRTIQGATVTVDNIDLAMSGECDDYGLMSYNIPSAFIGAHSVVISYPQCEDYETTIYVGSYDDYIVTRSFKLKNDVRQSLATTTEDVFKTLCNSAITGSETYTLCVNETPFSEVSDTYDNLTSYLRKDDGTGLKSITFNSFSDNSSQVLLGDDLTYKCSIGFSYDYIKLYKSWGSDEIIEQPSDYSRNGYVTVTYEYSPVEGNNENYEWQLSSIDNYRLYY